MIPHEQLHSGAVDAPLLVEHQRLATSGARAVVPFVVESSLRLAVPQLAVDIPGTPAYMNGGDSNVEMLIYRWVDDRFEQDESLPLAGGEDAVYFLIDGAEFLATTGVRTGAGPYDLNTDAFIYRRSRGRWEVFQRVPTFAGKQWYFFSFDDRHFLGLAQGVVIAGTEARNPDRSCLLEWSGTCFVEFQIVDGRWGYNWAFFEIGGQRFLTYADHVSPSVLMVWNGMRFTPIQELSQTGGRAFQFFEADGRSWLAFANLTGESILFRWSEGRFVPHQSLGGPGAREFALSQSGQGTYLVKINFIHGTPAAPKTDLNSSIYRWDRDRLTLVEEFPTFGGTGAAFFSVGAAQYLAVSNSLSTDIRFRQDTLVYRFNQSLQLVGRSHPIFTPRNPTNVSYNPHPEFSTLYKVYTADPDSIGSHLTSRMAQRSAADPLLVVTGSDFVLFPGSGAVPIVESFRRTTRGFIELASVSHLGTAVAWIIQLRELGDPVWRADAGRLIDQIDRTRQINTLALWQSAIGVEALAGYESKITDMIDYGCAITRSFLEEGLRNESTLTFRSMRENYLDPKGSVTVPVPVNDLMVATFCLAFLDIAYRINRWLQGHMTQWERLMVMFSGRSGRPTAGLTWASNSMCHLIWRASNRRLPPEHLYIAPHAPAIALDAVRDTAQMKMIETEYRRIWCNTRASVDLARAMFQGYPSFDSTAPLAANEMPALTSPEDRFNAVTRLRFAMEDPTQLLVNSVASYIIDQLSDCGNDPTKVVIPGFTSQRYPASGSH